jgi:hypothetical protein
MPRGFGARIVDALIAKCRIARRRIILTTDAAHSPCRPPRTIRIGHAHLPWANATAATATSRAAIFVTPGGRIIGRAPRERTPSYKQAA